MTGAKWWPTWEKLGESSVLGEGSAMNLIEHFRKWFCGEKYDRCEFDTERLRAEFAARYDCFRELLSANKRALNSFAALELAGQSGETGSMADLRRHCTDAVVGVQRMINSLNALAPGRYTGLETRFSEIRHGLEKALEPSPKPDWPLVMSLQRLGMEDSLLAGPKMASLGMLASSYGLSIPKGFVITTAAYGRLVEHNGLRDEIDRLLQVAELADTGGLFQTCSEIQDLFIHAEVPAAVVEEVERELGRLEQRTASPLRIAMRSSASGEDQAGASFAGQFVSELNVDPKCWRESYLLVAASLYGPSAVSYRMLAGLKDHDATMAVGCLAMVDAVAGGVIYTANPSGPDNEKIHIESCWGLPKAVVDGAWDCDRFELEPGPPVKLTAKKIAVKNRRYKCDPVEGVLPEKLSPELSTQSSLNDDRALELARIALGMSRRMGRHLDIEWAMDRDGGSVVLQCRTLPMTAERRGSPVAAEGMEAILKGGVTASPGTGCGCVRWVRNGADALLFNRGEILAVEQPLPRWAPLLGKASAVISLNGGLAGHLASVARELGLPALFGIGPPGSAVAQGSKITVDASAGVVYRGYFESIQPLPAKAVPCRPSPLSRTWSAVLDLTAPLNLLDPEAGSFSPQNCKTLHDLTRFCHQKAVEEMFSLAAGKHFPANAARRLYYKVPMQWWVLDLGGGVKQSAAEAKGKMVRMENVVCRPFKAFWEGLTEIPWEGPPAPCAGGMASVMFLATMNPAPGLPSRNYMREQNYFLIERDFMNMQSRIGFHFTTLEASSGENPAENFVGFCFRGGAADTARRVARLVLLEGLLIDLGLDAEVRGDSVLARGENLPDGECLFLVKALGYLTMHTRQLDMIMFDHKSAGHYRSKLKAGISKLGRPAHAGPTNIH